jgi:UDP:flavonoid glycosyltransferase YjiC (YdhE family)
MLDQHYWGHRVAQLGLGPTPVPRRALTGKRLSEALALTLSQNFRVRAAEFSRELRTDGIEAALSQIDREHSIPSTAGEERVHA